MIKDSNKQGSKQEIQNNNQIIIQESQQKNHCLIVKNLDNGKQQFFTSQKVNQLNISVLNEDKDSVWNQYWQSHHNMQTTLMQMVINQSAQQLQRILQQHPIDINKYVYMDGWSLLHFATSGWNPAIVRLLVNIGKAKIQACSQSMVRTSLHQAVLANKQVIVQQLIILGANPNVQDLDFMTPLHYAVNYGYDQLVEILLTSQYKIQFYLKNYQQMTILDCCRTEKLYQRFINKIKQQDQKSCCQEEKIIYKQKQKNQCVEKFNKVNRRLVYDDERMITTKSRADHIQLLLSQQKNIKKSSEKQLFEPTIIKTTSKLGSKFPNQRWQRISKLAKKSLKFMKQSIVKSKEQTTGINELQNYERLRKIGRGGFAEVFLVRKKQSSNLYALKKINKKYVIDHNIKKHIYSERNVLLKVSHPFVISAHTFLQDQCSLYILMQYCEGGDMQNFFNKKQIKENDARKYAAELILVLGYLHSLKIIFRDLKSANVLLDVEGHVKLTDFGLATQAIIGYSFLGTLAYLPPEMLVNKEMKQHCAVIDWYLLGVFLFQILVRQPPFYSNNQKTMIENIKLAKPQFPKYLELSDQCKSFIAKLLQKVPEKRLGFKNDIKQIQQHPWLKDIDWDQVQKRKVKMPEPILTISQKQIRKKVTIIEEFIGVPEKFFPDWNHMPN